MRGSIFQVAATGRRRGGGVVIDRYYFLRYYFPVKVTVKGQVTIPREIREVAGMLPGTEVEFIRRKNVVIVRPIKSRKERLASVIERSRGAARAGLSTDELMEITRGED